MSMAVLDEATELTHRRLAPPACRRGVPRARRGRRADRREPAFARSGRCSAGRRAIEVAEWQVRSGAGAFSPRTPGGGVITRDPLDGEDGFADVANPYAYSHNDPLNWMDPSGMRAKDDDFTPPPPPPPDPLPCSAASIPPAPSNPPADPGAGEWGSEPWYSRGDDYAFKEVAWAAADAADLKGAHHAAGNLRHYLDNSGDTLNTNPDDIANDVPAFKDYLAAQARGEATSAAKQAIAGGRFDCAIAFTSSWSGFYITKELSEDWFYADGGVNTSVTGIVTVHQGDPPQVTVEYRSHLYDRYNWDKGKETHIGPITVTDERMGALQRAGLAREYDIMGSSQVHTYTCALDQSCPSTIKPDPPPPGGGR